MIHPENLLTDLKRWVTRLEDDLRERCDEDASVDAVFQEAYQTAKKANRTAHPYATWRDQELTQVAVAWVLGCVFVRFLEDNQLVDEPWISGPGTRLEQAGEVRERYFRSHPTKSDNDYLKHVFERVAELPGMGDLFDGRHNPLWQAAISGDAAREFIEFWRKIDGNTGKLVHDFQDPDWDTRFLGDLYQNLSEAAQKRFALLQTPDFVEDFILERTLDPAIETFGFRQVRIIDPACGSGHFLLGAYERMLAHWRAADPGMGNKEVAAKALAAIHGVDINPFAVAIARFRLLLEAWRYAGVTRLKAAPNFQVKVAVGDALFHSPEPGEVARPDTLRLRIESSNEVYGVEDAALLAQVLGQKYHAVVANPPYITVKDKALNKAYRDKYDSAFRKYSMAAPFMELIFDLAVKGDPGDRKPAGYTGQITANSFMKREFGKKLVEECLPAWDLTHVLDTSGCYIPGHGTPTVILYGRHQKPASDTVRAVLGIKGEPETPDDPTKGKVWSAILDQIDRPGSESEWVSSGDIERGLLAKHPWVIQGGPSQETLSLLNSRNVRFINCVQFSRKRPVIGFSSILGEEDAFLYYANSQKMRKISSTSKRPYLFGEQIRDWSANTSIVAIFPYSSSMNLDHASNALSELWPLRSILWARQAFSGETYKEQGRAWFSFHQLPKERNLESCYITYPFVSTHNHFHASKVNRLQKQAAPLALIKRGVNQVSLVGALNSSTALFWARQTLFPKGGYPEGRWQERLEWDGTKLQNLPIPDSCPQILPSRLDSLAGELGTLSPENVLTRWQGSEKRIDAALNEAEQSAASIRARMIALQEELDWQCYRLYGLIDAKDDLDWPEDRLEELPELSLGERAFEILMARQMAGGELETTWFERHKHAGSKPVTEIPAHWPEEYRRLVERRLACIEANKNIHLIERPEYKRRWNTKPWAERQTEALRQWLLARLEAYAYDGERMVEAEDESVKARILGVVKKARARFPAGSEPRLFSTRQLADAAHGDDQWMEAARLYTGDPSFDVGKLVRELVEKEAVPHLPARRYKDSGLRNRREWEKTWNLQRAEDAVEARVRKENPGLNEEDLKKAIREAQQKEVGEVPVPPKYKTKDFQKGTYWKLRGKLDVPKERWISYPGAEKAGDASPVLAWAGWNPLQQLQALAAYYHECQTEEGWEPERLRPLLAGMKDLLPWVNQWHNEVDPDFNMRMGDFYETYLQEQTRELGFTEADVERERIG